MRIETDAIVFLCCLLVGASIVGAEYEEECKGNEDDFVKVAGNCKAYIYCDVNEPFMGECDDGSLFDGEVCETEDLVQCDDNIEEELETEEEVETQTEADETTEKPHEVEENPVIVENTPKPEETGAHVEEQEVVPEQTEETNSITPKPDPIEEHNQPEGSEEVPTNQLPDPTNDQQPITPVEEDQTTSESCPMNDLTNRLVFIPSKTSCTEYSLCYHGNPIKMQCANNLHFNAAAGNCDLAEKANCTLNRPRNPECRTGMEAVFPHPERCEYFYYCRDGHMTLQQCSFYYHFDVDRQMCVLQNRARCYASQF